MFMWHLDFNIFSVKSKFWTCVENEANKYCFVQWEFASQLKIDNIFLKFIRENGRFYFLMGIK